MFLKLRFILVGELWVSFGLLLLGSCANGRGEDNVRRDILIRHIWVGIAPFFHVLKFELCNVLKSQ